MVLKRTTAPYTSIWQQGDIIAAQVVNACICWNGAEGSQRRRQQRLKASQMCLCSGRFASACEKSWPLPAAFKLQSKTMLAHINMLLPGISTNSIYKITKQEQAQSSALDLICSPQ